MKQSTSIMVRIKEPTLGIKIVNRILTFDGYVKV